MKLRLAMFYHSLVSDWNHGNAHFLRGVVSELQARGHDVQVFEPEDSWSRKNLEEDAGSEAIEEFERAFPNLRSQCYRLAELDLNECLDGVDLVIAHEWNEPVLISGLANYRRRHQSIRLFFHDTHHRASSAQHELALLDLAEYDAILAYGESLRDAYLKRGWGRQVYVWHEAADTRIFFPRASLEKSGDVVWIGNWGDEERSQELQEFLVEPVKRAKLTAEVYGVRYPPAALRELSEASISYRGWLPNFRVPDVFARYRATVHVPRRPYVEHLPGIPTIRLFEALACGIPLVSAPWTDSEGLFRAGEDFLMARTGNEMQRKLERLIHEPDLARALARNGLETIRARHTCAHRVDELLNIYEKYAPGKTAESPVEAGAGQCG